MGGGRAGVVCAPGDPPFPALRLLLKILLNQAAFSTAIRILLGFHFLTKMDNQDRKTKGPITSLHFTPKQNKMSFQFFFFDRKQRRSSITSFS